LPSASAFDQAEHAEASAGSEEDAQTVLTSRAGVGVAALDQTHPVSADAPASDAIAGEPADRETQRLPAEPAAREEQPAQNVQTSKPDDTDVTATELLTVENEPEPDARGAVVLDVSSGQTPVVDHPASAETAVGDITDAARDVDATPVAEIPDETEAAAATDVAPTEGPNVDAATTPVVLRITGLSRRFGDTVAVDGIDLDVHKGSFYGIVGPNGAGKTTTLSMVTGLLRPDAGNITVHGVDVWNEPDVAKRSIGVLPDRLRLFDRLTGAQLLYYSGVLRGLDGATVRARTRDLARAFGLEDALNRLVTDYSAGMTKKVALAAAMIHSPRLLVLDEPFESVDPVSAANVIEILQKYVAHGGTVVLSSHGMDLIQRVCDHVAIIVHGTVLAAGAVDDVRGSGTLEERFVELAGGRKAAEGMEWLHSFSD
jgi:ABC-2 type transport system ATP-binding protein